MSIFEGCLLASDIDGTLVYGDVLPNENIKYIKKFVNEGGIFTLCTGRAMAGTMSIIEMFDFKGLGIFENGALIADCKTGEILKQDFLPDDALNLARQFAKKYPNIGILGCAGKKMCLVNENEFLLRHSFYEKYTLDYSFDDDIKINKFVCFLDSSDNLDEAMEDLKRLFKNSDIIRTSLTMDGVFRELLECMPKGVNKSVGVDFLLEKFAISRENYFAIGDFYNDLPIISAASIGAAVAESPCEVKNKADFVAGSAKDGAVADFIKYLIKTRKGV